MLHRFLLAGFVALLASFPATAQVAPTAAVPPALAAVPVTTPQYDSAYYAWQAGDYPAALQRFERMLTGPKASDVLEPIALVTGELYLTTELSADGSQPRWSRDSKTAAFTSVTGPARIIHFVSLAGEAPRETGVVSGFGVVFSPAKDEAAYLAVTETPELAAARAAMDQAIKVQDFQIANRARGDVTRLEAANSRVRVRDLATGTDRDVATPGLSTVSLAYGRDGTLYLLGNANDVTRRDVYSLAGTAPKQLTDTPRIKTFVGATGTHLIYNDSGLVRVKNLATGDVQQFPATGATLSADGSTLAYVAPAGKDTVLNVYTIASGQTVIAKQTPFALANPALSADGKRVAFQMMPREDWEVYVVENDGTGETRVTRDPQDDLLPAFIGNDRLLVKKGEGRHRRSYLYHIATANESRLFHNNTVRTVSPEYAWALSPDGSKVLIEADRDGNTISPEHGLYVTDLGKRVTAAQLLDRIRSQAAGEKDLRARGMQMFAAIAPRVRPIVADISSDRIYTYSKVLFQMDTRQVTKPGNLKAIEYFVALLKSWGYEPDVQWFEPRPGLLAANVVATLKGTKFPQKIHVMSAHFDTVERAPGSDDDGTGVTALLEAARVMAGHPQPATIQFAFLTGEETGGLGAREFVRRAKADSSAQLVGVLNNDMGGWMEDGRYDDTIRYASDYLRDVEHAAAIQFSKLITYDARYYRGTDAGTFYDAYGPIVSGIGGYPILASPHYHETHDVLETISPHLIAEIARTSVASIILMAQQPELPKTTS
ncbi:MAG: M20/M25/M40 family metallo-hydrolase [Gemmatimonadetes bacterium]|nr:M20/M25/M40 family metallo-hydrolase [Gemmatimonadota bacterium]